MKRFLLPILFALALVGCGSLNADYVRADRANYDAIAPIVSGYVHDTLVPPTDNLREVYEAKLVLWNARIAAAEKALAEAEEE